MIAATRPRMMRLAAKYADYWTSLILPNDAEALSDPIDIRERLAPRVDLIIDGGSGGLTATTVVDLTVSPPEVVRQGLGAFA